MPHGAAPRPSARRQCIKQICIDEAEGEHDRQAQRDGCQVGVQGGAKQQVPALVTTDQLSSDPCRLLDLPSRPCAEGSAQRATHIAHRWLHQSSGRSAKVRQP